MVRAAAAGADRIQGNVPDALVEKKVGILTHHVGGGGSVLLGSVVVVVVGSRSSLCEFPIGLTHTIHRFTKGHSKGVFDSGNKQGRVRKLIIPFLVYILNVFVALVVFVLV